MRTWRALVPALASLGLVVGLVVPAQAEVVDVSARPPEPLRARVSDPDLWLAGERLEALDQWLPAALLYEELARRHPLSPLPRWRTARAYVIAGELLPTDSNPSPLTLYEWAEHWADGAIALAPDCAATSSTRHARR